ncbi:transposase [Streptomyces sp. NPDC005799]|uniref:transposase n=1 Tax=Streptomyces sp. NPDC005799 TaxID=3154678 RepID=UPI0033ECB3C2
MLSMMDIILPGPKPLIFDVRQSGSSPGLHRRVPGDGAEGGQRPREHRRRSPAGAGCRARADTPLLPGQDPGAGRRRRCHARPAQTSSGAEHHAARRTVRYTVGWTITPEDERAIARLPEAAWETSLRQDGKVQDGCFVAEMTREGWPKGMRLIVRRVKPSRRHLGKLTAFEQKTGRRYSITATDIRHIGYIAGTHQVQFLDVLHRDHAEAEDRVRTNKAMGLANLPSKSRETNASWMLTANLAADLDTWLRLLTLHDHADVAHAEPDTMRFRLYRPPARLVHHTRRRHLRIERTWPWAQTSTTSWKRINNLTAAT